MGRYFDTSLAVATFATFATKRSKFADLSQQSQDVEAGEFDCDNLIDLRHLFEERAAIMEFDGGMTREDAEQMAAADTGFDPDAE